MPEPEIKYIQNGLLNDTRLENELNNIIRSIIANFDYKIRNLNLQAIPNFQQETSTLVNALLTPLLARGNETSLILQSLNTSGSILTPSQIPNLPTSKITNGNFVKARLPNDTIYSNLTRTAGTPIAGGTVVITDNNGNSQTFLVI